MSVCGQCKSHVAAVNAGFNMFNKIIRVLLLYWKANFPIALWESRKCVMWLSLWSIQKRISLAAKLIVSPWYTTPKWLHRCGKPMIFKAFRKMIYNWWVFHIYVRLQESTHPFWATAWLINVLETGRLPWPLCEGLIIYRGEIHIPSIHENCSLIISWSIFGSPQKKVIFCCLCLFSIYHLVI